MHEALPRFEDLVFGGHELTDASLLKRAELLVNEGVVPPSLPAVTKSLNQANANIRPGISMEGPSRRADGSHPARAGSPAQLSLGSRARKGGCHQRFLDGTPIQPHPAHSDLGALREALE